MPSRVLVPASVVHPWTLESIGVEQAHLGSAGGTLADCTSGAWPTGNLAIYIPFRLYSPALAQKIIVMNGATASNNMDVGIYGAEGTRLVSSGSTAQSGTTTVQEFDITDTMIGPGLFYMALAFNGTSGTVYRGAFGGTTAGLYTQTSAFALPASATFATCTIANFIPLIGVVFNKTLV